MKIYIDGEEVEYKKDDDCCYWIYLPSGKWIHFAMVEK